MNTVLNQNVNVTKRARFATFAMSIVDKLCLLQQCKWNKTKQNTGHTDQISWPFLTCSSEMKKLAVVERLFWQLATRFRGSCRCTEV